VWRKGGRLLRKKKTCWKTKLFRETGLRKLAHNLGGVMRWDPKKKDGARRKSFVMDGRWKTSVTNQLEKKKEGGG